MNLNPICADPLFVTYPSTVSCDLLCRFANLICTVHSLGLRNEMFPSVSSSRVYAAPVPYRWFSDSTLQCELEKAKIVIGSCQKVVSLSNEKKEILPDRESNPGLPRSFSWSDKRKS